MPKFKRSSQQYRVSGFSCVSGFARRRLGEGDGVQNERSGFLMPPSLRESEATEGR